MSFSRRSGQKPEGFPPCIYKETTSEQFRHKAFFPCNLTRLKSVATTGKTAWKGGFSYKKSRTASFDAVPLVDDTRLELVTSRTSSGCATSCANRPGGDKRDRTADLLNAIQALSQLSYTPVNKRYNSIHYTACQGINFSARGPFQCPFHLLRSAVLSCPQPHRRCL